MRIEVVGGDTISQQARTYAEYRVFAALTQVADAERVRRWLGHDDADFIVKTFAAVIGAAPTVERTTDCAVLTPEQLGPWIDALPPQRSLTDSRRQQVVEMVREAAG